MYNISDLVVAISSFFVIYNSYLIVDKIIPGTYKKVLYNNSIFFIDFCIFICDHNPLCLEFYDKIVEEVVEVEVEELAVVTKKIETKFEDKYLEKFKAFPNEFCFSLEEMDEEQNEYERIKSLTEKSKSDIILEIQGKLFKINEIQENGNITNDTDKHYTENINNFGKSQLIEYFDLQEDDDDIDFEELYTDLMKEKDNLEKDLKEAEDKIITDDEFKEMARKYTVNKKLDKFTDNYILESTPLGNIYMRYNNSKGSFEYFSNNTIPYRYLEPVGRKYVMIYWCKPIFIDLQEELKRAEIKYDDEMKKRDVEEKRRQEDIKNNPNNLKSVMARMKSYNKDTNNNDTKNKSSVKNRSLPPQIKATVQNISQNSEKRLLKENANRYTWEGRLTGFCPLKKIDKKVVNKQLSMTYADFKKLSK
jgi:hypothetical protein